MARQMKDSGVEWIGEIPEEWEVARLKTRFFFGKGLPITKENLVPAGVPVVSYGQVHSKSNNGTALSNELFRFVDESYLATNPQSLVHRGDFIVADTSEDVEGCGNCVYVDSDLVLFAGYHTIILFDKEARDNKYFAYLFQSNEWRNQIRCKASGVKVFSISRKILSDAYCTVPPTAEQTAISTYLDLKCAEIDKVVEQTRATIEEYKKLKQAIITEAVTKGVRGPRPMKSSGVEWIGDIPEEWQSHKLRYVSSIKSGDYVDAQDLSPDGIYPVYGGGEQISSYHSYNVNEETIIIGRVGARCGCVTLTKKKCWATDNALILMSHMYTRFAYYVLTGANLNTLNTSNAQPLITGTKIMNLVIPNPCKEEQKEIAAYLDTKCAEIDRIIEKKEQLIEELGSYKKSLIYEYVTGKKEVTQK